MKTCIQLVFVALLAGCAQSENPLLGEANEPDLYLLGTWYFAGMDANGALIPGDSDEYFDVTLDGDNFRMNYYEGDKVTVFELLTTRIGPSRYVSMRPVEWIGFDEGQPSGKDEMESCPWQILLYQTFLPKPLPGFEYAGEAGSKLDATAESYAAVVREANRELRGNLLFIQFMKPDVIHDAIKQNEIAGSRKDAMSSPCIMAPPEQLRAFIAGRRDMVYTGEEWFPIVRATD
jgi:hypothetical protein